MIFKMNLGFLYTKDSPLFIPIFLYLCLPFLSYDHYHFPGRE